MRRHRKQRDQGSVEMNLAAMLDMAFQLLTFFILTFRPAPIEGQLAVHLPSGVIDHFPAAEDPDKLGPVVRDDTDKTLHLHVTAGPAGEVSQLTLEKADTINGPLDASRVQTLDKKLQSIFAMQDVPFDRAQIAVDGKLHYGELMKIVDVCSRQKTADGDVVKKISFTEL